MEGGTDGTGRIGGRLVMSYALFSTVSPRQQRSTLAANPVKNMSRRESGEASELRGIFRSSNRARVVGLRPLGLVGLTCIPDRACGRRL